MESLSNSNINTPSTRNVSSAFALQMLRTELKYSFSSLKYIGYIPVTHFGAVNIMVFASVKFYQ